MRIAIDYDGTVADTNRAKVAWIRQHLGREVAPWECNRTDCVPIIGEAAYEAMGDWVYERESTLATGEVPGASEALRRLAARADLYVVTARPPRRLDFAREWFGRQGLEGLIREFHSSESTSKEDVCRSIGAGALIDDDLRHLRGVRLPGLSRVLLQHGRDELPTTIEFRACRSWDEVLALFAEP